MGKGSMRKLGRWFIGFGVFLFVSGVLGYASNPEGAKTALLTGSFFGAINFGIGLGLMWQQLWLRFAALAVTLLLITAFSWRATVGWQEVASGEPKLFAASLISLMLVGAVLTLIQLLRFWKRE